MDSVPPIVALRNLNRLDRSDVLAMSWRLSDSSHYTRVADFDPFLIGLCWARLPNGEYGPVIASWHTPRQGWLKPVCLALFYTGSFEARVWKRGSPPWSCYIGDPDGQPSVINGDCPKLGWRVSRKPMPWYQAG